MRFPLFVALSLAGMLGAALAADDGLSLGANEAFLAANAKKPGVISKEGIQYRVIKAGSGRRAGALDCVNVTYSGKLINGTVFDATKPNQPATFPVGGLITGWTRALEMMHVGDDWELVIPANLAYGSRGAGNGLIPPNQTLVFELQLLNVKPSDQGDCS